MRIPRCSPCCACCPAGNLDFLAFGLVLLMSAVLCTGVRESTIAIVGE